MPIAFVCPACGARANLSRREWAAPAPCRRCGARVDASPRADEPVTIVMAPDPARQAFAPAGAVARTDLGGRGVSLASSRRRRRRSAGRGRRLAARLLVGVGLLALAATVGYAASLVIAPPSDRVRPDPRSPEYRVAEFGAGPGSHPADGDVFRYRFLLRRVGESYGLPAADVAGRALVASARLRSLGLPVDIESMLGGAIESAERRVDPSPFSPPFDRFLAAYARLREQGRDHQEAVDSIDRENLLGSATRL